MGRFLDCSCEILASWSAIIVFALWQAKGTRLARESRSAELELSSIAAFWGWESAGEMVMARRGRSEIDFILEEVFCKSGAWTAGLV